MERVNFGPTWPEVERNNIYMEVNVNTAVEAAMEENGQNEVLTAVLPKLKVTVRPIEPRGNLFGFASVKMGGVTVHDFKIVENKEGGLFVGMPSKPDGKGGYRNTVYVDKDVLEEFNAAVIDEYHSAVEKLQARAAAAVTDKPRIADQMAEASKQAAKDNAKRPAPAKGKNHSAELG